MSFTKNYSDPNANKVQDALFVHVPRTAGESIAKAFGICTFHKAIRDVTNPLFTFTFVRNPWDRAVSAFFYLSEAKKSKSNIADQKTYGFQKYQNDFDQFIREQFTGERKILEQKHFRPQSYWICNNEGEIAIDFVGRFETLQNDFDRLCKQLSIETVTLPRQNGSSHKKYTTYYTDETKKLVAKAYQEDIKLLEYSFA